MRDQSEPLIDSQERFMKEVIYAQKVQNDKPKNLMDRIRKIFGK